MSLSALQLERLRRDLGDVATAFTDVELNDNWDRLTSAPNDDVRFEATKGLCFEQLLNNASKLGLSSSSKISGPTSITTARTTTRYSPRCAVSATRH